MMQTSISASHVTNAAGKSVVPNLHASLEIIVMRTTASLAWLSHAGFRRIGGLLLALLMLALVPTAAHATCTFTGGTTTSPVSFSPNSTITIPYNAAVGTVIYTSPLIAPTNTPQMTCTGTTNYGIINSVGAQPATTATVYPTGISGLGYSITHGNTTTYLSPYGCCQLASGSYQFSITSSLQLIKTGPIVSGSTLSAGLLGYWQFANSQQVETFTLANSVTIIDPACSVNTTPINVTLPTMNASALGSTGASAGRTGFNISLNCSSGATLDIQLNYVGTNTGITGVLKSTGSAGGVGVQLLDQNSNPVVFGNTTVLGATPNNSQWNIPYFAQYYRTGTVTAGSVTASATFTLSYQ